MSSSGPYPSLHDQCSMLSNLCRLCNFYLEHVIFNHDVIFISNITGFYTYILLVNLFALAK